MRDRSPRYSHRRSRPSVHSCRLCCWCESPSISDWQKCLGWWSSEFLKISKTSGVKYHESASNTHRLIVSLCDCRCSLTYGNHTSGINKFTTHSLISKESRASDKLNCGMNVAKTVFIRNDLVNLLNCSRNKLPAIQSGSNLRPPSTTILCTFLQPQAASKAFNRSLNAGSKTHKVTAESLHHPWVHSTFFCGVLICCSTDKSYLGLKF